MQQTVESVHKPEAVPPFEVQLDLEEQMPCNPQSPMQDCMVVVCFLLLKELRGIIGGKKKTGKLKMRMNGNTFLFASIDAKNKQL